MLELRDLLLAPHTHTSPEDSGIEATVALAAYVYASVSLTRDAYDYMAQLLNAVASVSRVSPHKVDADTVFPLVRPGRIRKLLDDARASDAYAYVVAFSNVTKHRRALPFSFSVSLESGASHFGPPAFTKLGKKNVSHDALKTSHILGHCKELWIRLDEIGRAINDDRGVANRLGT
jgi:hypothetical protein